MKDFISTLQRIIYWVIACIIINAIWPYAFFREGGIVACIMMTAVTVIIMVIVKVRAYCSAAFANFIIAIVLTFTWLPAISWSRGDEGLWISIIITCFYIGFKSRKDYG